MNRKAIKKKSAAQQMGTLIMRQVFILRSNIKKLLMIILLPVVTAVIVCGVSSNRMFESYEDTKSTLFTMVCVAIWIGLFNSIQEICQERGILKREYMANLKLFSYISSKFIVQAVLCLLQALVFLSICGIFIEFPEEGIITGNATLDIFVTMFLIMLASDAMGLLISSLVKSGDLANIIAPVILILQLVMSGVLFTLEGATKYISYVTVSKWGMEGLGSIAKLNDLEMNVILEAKDDATRQTLESVMEREVEDIFSATTSHIIETWLILIGFSVLFLILASLALRRISKDTR